MSLPKLNTSFVRAERRLLQNKRRRRSDAGSSRFSQAVQDKMRQLLLQTDRPRISDLMRELKRYCIAHGERCPSRASLYNFAKNVQAHSYLPKDLQRELRDSLYNLAQDQPVPGHQLVFYALHNGNTAAICQAAALPWLDLYQASLLPGWRPRSRGLLRAIMRSRGIV